MYKNILVPIAFDSDAKVEAAMSVARELAAEGAEVTLLHVIEHIPGYAVTYMPPDYLVQSHKAVQDDLDALAAKMDGARGVVVDGHSGRTILDYAADAGSDLIVIASHRPGMGDLLMGSTATQVVRHAKCAVHVLR
ncbi:universal stress family protein [Citreicella sp. SE45]|uniref:Nucleotide-binding universal stress protein, UspA family n=1 Tax=Salipiger thiooxidans TaxID=282683 RepID=A0A1G7KYX3_9RHOB|nr:MULTISPECIES: universal stress protein [Salipiger]EEX16768.1 universal stress family protein [Citreicella sp. SE45]MAU43802.1 universal stress protein [Salipiger sp.]NVK61652.1 universal stress protein [Paracoccaceae bacterium]NIY99190.1 universal stress protein [Salipiger sp. HF18]SDF42296.1 Nucleotide-binding universal stress protein, UspA family [Salipiger thiooxidans]